ncbi:hypothetical protein NMG60_11003996 [Bertholletia excelsa]
MDSPTQYSSNRCCIFVFFFLSFIIAALVVVTLVIIFILKPKEPIFSLQNIRLDWYELQPCSGSILFLSSVASLNLTAQNPNKVGIGYDSTRFHVLRDGLPIGEIRVPRFYQPPKSQNVSIRTRLLIPSLNVSRLIEGSSSKNGSTNSSIKMKILGDITACLHLLHVTLPKFKIALDCDIGIDYRDFVGREQLYTAAKVFEESFVSFSSQHQWFSKNCSLAFYL